MKDKRKVKVKADNKAPERKRGAPVKRDNDKVENNGLTREQNRQLRSLSLQRDVSFKSILREAVGWYLDALEMGRREPIINQELETAEEADIDQ